MMKANLRNKDNGMVKQNKVGFSWTFFFWGFWVTLFRQDWKWFLISIIVDGVGAFLTYGMMTFIYNIIMSFIYNKIYIKGLVENGYRPTNQSDKDILMGRGYITNTTKTVDEETSTQN